jgi:hypothetical protein
MTAIGTYSTGTVSVANGDTAIVGAGGANWFRTNVKPGDDIVIAGNSTVVVDVTDATHLAIKPWPHDDVAAGTYTIYQNSVRWAAGQDSFGDMTRFISSLDSLGLFYMVDPTLNAPDPSLGEYGQYAMQVATRKIWSKSFDPLVGWEFVGYFAGLNPKGEWDVDTAYLVADSVELDGSSYVAVQNNTGQMPPNITYWQLLSAAGSDATITIGTTTTGAPGTNADVTNSGTPGAAVLDFTIPAGKSYGGTSTTSLAIGTGSKAFTTQAGLAYLAGARVRASSTANTSNWMEGLATYSGTTLTITVDKTNGSGTIASWNLNVVGQPGAGDLTAANNLSDVASAVTALKNLGAPAALRNYLAGLTLSTAGSSAAFGIAAGVATDSTNADFLALASAYTKTTSAWAVGSGNGALDTGSIANNTWYHAHLIKRPDTGVVDVLVSLSATAPTLPTNYTLFRRIGSMKTSSSQWIKFSQKGDEFLWDTRTLDVNAVAAAASAVLWIINVPTNIKVNVLGFFRLDQSGGSCTTIVTSPDESDQGIVAGSFTATVNASGLSPQTAFLNVRTNTSAQIRVRSTGTTGIWYWTTLGWIDDRGRNN